MFIKCSIFLSSAVQMDHVCACGSVWVNVNCMCTYSLDKSFGSLQLLLIISSYFDWRITFMMVNNDLYSALAIEKRSQWWIRRDSEILFLHWGVWVLLNPHQDANYMVASLLKQNDSYWLAKVVQVCNWTELCVAQVWL